MEVVITPNYNEMSKLAAQMVAELLNTKPNAVLGMATGSTPLGLYQELVRMYQRGQLDFSRVMTFNLDEYVGLPGNHPQSYYYFMQENFFQHVNVQPQNINVPSGTTSNYPAFCEWYEKRIVECGGIDLQILGIGSDGHIAFNEPTSSLSSRTRLKTLSMQTIDDNARFFERREDVPVYAITMGVGTILEARQLLLVASGKSKARAIAQAVEGPVTQHGDRERAAIASRRDRLRGRGGGVGADDARLLRVHLRGEARGTQDVVATYAARTASPPPPRRTQVDLQASSRYASIARRTVSAHGPLSWGAQRARTHRSIPAPPAPAGAFTPPVNSPLPGSCLSF